jgi:hypothetical protein
VLRPTEQRNPETTDRDWHRLRGHDKDATGKCHFGQSGLTLPVCSGSPNSRRASTLDLSLNRQRKISF